MDEPQTQAPNFFYPSRAVVCTQPFSRFLTDYHANVDHFLFLIQLVSNADENRMRAATALLPGARNSDERARLEKTIPEPDLVLNQLKRHSTVNSRI
jgi:hypothetical protein